MNGLPTFENMKTKGMHTACGEELESLTHALISCDSALSIWLLWQDFPIRSLLEAKDYTELAHQILTGATT